LKAGREHYESVGKSKLRKPAQQVLDQKYEGVAVSREALNADEENDPFAPLDDEDDEDPFAERGDDSDDEEEEDDDLADVPNVEALDGEVDEDDEIDSDEAFEEGDEEKFKAKGFTFRGSNMVKRDRKDLEDDEDDDDDEAVSGSEGEESLDEDGLDMDEEDEDMSEGGAYMNGDESVNKDDDMSDQSSASSTEEARPPQVGKDKKIRAMLSKDEDVSTLASSLSASANADVRKGRAVKQQYQTFDRLLDARIKLQKGVAAAKEFQLGSVSDEDVATAARKAEDAALNLWSTVDAIRRSMLDDQQRNADGRTTSKKRKQSLPATRATSVTELWERTGTTESAALPYRRAVLDKWSRNTRSSINAAPKSKLLDPSQQAEQNKFTSVIDTYLTTERDKLVKTSTSSDGPLSYDDSTFYQSLLRDLIASRAANANGTTSDMYIPPVIKLHQSGSKNKKVDTKASKGRKVRYTVHEKLENFMAAEDRTVWEDAARREFFGSLFGQRRALDEDELEVDGMDGEEGDKEVEALRLFRS